MKSDGQVVLINACSNFILPFLFIFFLFVLVRIVRTYVSQKMYLDEHFLAALINFISLTQFIQQLGMLQLLLQCCVKDGFSTALKSLSKH